ncbi:homoserine dehydrogenase [Lactiplantibacillus fabifermentans T30PCM01]|uniref:Homoserine dehydrogenase n=1 Tax=Lactiplantibacillus fabifermentans T30PCM01 TaxID=1400520 RepID=W6T6F9_9LACO|nr:homoserine dehydrogenase [Lactiplantibacillus fabifermentans]ETY73629.1 homoserine dehydrogenase [Lactiplantibacillus fabifermentans T30PCM01]
MTQTIEVGMLGLGTVGSGVVARLTRAATKIEQTQGLRLHLATVAVHHLRAPRAVQLPVGTRLTDDWQQVVTDPRIQLVIEVMGTIATAKAAIIAALTHGKSVVTANKDLMATNGEQLIALAQRQGCDLFYEASVAGGIPILRTLTDSYATDQVQRVAGIINGTANYILTAMTSQGQSYQTALTAAQQAGYAEADPTNDVTGLDTAYKLCILSQFAFGQTVDLTRLQPTGITALTATDCQQAQQAGYQLKLLAQAERHGSNLYVRVAPTAIPQTSALSQVAGVQNGVAITSDAIGDSLYTGPGAGSTATANSVLNDVLVAANHLVTATRGLAFNRNHVQLRVHALDQLPQRYLLVSSLSRLTLQTYANEVDFSIQPTAGPALITTAVTPTQLAQLQRLTTINGQAQVTAIPIAFSTQPAAAAVTAIQAVS